MKNIVASHAIKGKNLFRMTMNGDTCSLEALFHERRYEGVPGLNPKE